ncbi:MAG TPA: anhydro-N-acetylmuramic acid kinase [Candidatus Marinimicrobia bacterium]|nr:anhydro-N-acetylmuramic acid kinase [Candidatus Neomarinimicrobiota bacterium]
MKSIWELHRGNSLNVLGLMSGTSMDGLDICLAKVNRSGSEIEARIEHYASYSYPIDYRERLLQLPVANTAEICRMNFDIARKYGDFIQWFLDKFQLSADDFQLIGSHGQTVWHIHRNSTLQIGEASVLAERFNVPVVSDFRVRDVAAGGSGAPLVPFIDYLLFKKYQKNLLVLNIGGIANFTLVPYNAISVNDIYALDTGPGNSLIDIAVQLASKGELTYDKDGEIAKKGQVRRDVLKYLLDHPYIKAPLPKSTGREVFGKDFVTEVIRRFNIADNDYPDLITTVTRFTAESIFFNYRQFFEKRYPLDEIIVSGGGADNPVLISYLAELFENVPVNRTDKYGVGSEEKEAFAFAVLAAVSVWGVAGNVPKVTGADHPVVLGKITF